MASRCHRSTLVLIAVVAAALPAQERKPVVGRVLDPAGNPAVAVSVTLAWTPPGGDEAGPTDVVNAITDARGRFIARLLPQEGYSAFAHTAVAADGTAAASEVHEDVAAGGDIELRLLPPQRPFRVRLADQEPWQALAPLALFVMPRAVNVLPFPVGADGLTPPLPRLGAVIVRDKDGETLFVRPLAEHGLDLEVALPPPQQVRFQVQDERGVPLPGARVFHRVAELTNGWSRAQMFGRGPTYAWRALGAADEKGRLDAVIARRVSRPGDHSWFAARHPGRAEGLAPPDMLDADGRLLLVLPPAPRLRFLDQGRGTGRTHSLVALYQSGFGNLFRGVQLRTDANSACEVPLPPDPLETLLSWTATDGARCLIRVPLAAGVETTVQAEALRRLSVQVLDADRGPARGVPAVLATVASRPHAMHLFTCYTDQAGRIERWVGRDEWLLVACDGRGLADATIRGDENAPTRQLVLQPLPLLRLRCLGPDLAPVAGARVTRVARNGSLPQPSGPVQQWLLQQIEDQLALRVRSDADGWLSIPIPGAAGHRTFNIAGNTWTGVAQRVPAEVAEHVVHLR